MNYQIDLYQENREKLELSAAKSLLFFLGVFLTLGPKQ